MRIKLVVVFLLVCLIYACGKSGEQKTGMYEPTELALLMKKMLKEYGEAKTALEQGEIPSERIDYIQGILTAEATDPADINELYKSLGAPFIEQAMRYAQTGDDLSEQIKMHNMTVSSCINCHQSFCGGPISAIKKLYVRR